MQIIDNVKVSLNSDGQTIAPMSTNLSLQKIAIIIRKMVILFLAK
jgi:hypothetical protein